MIASLSVFGRYYRWFFFFQAEDGIRDLTVTGVQTCALPIFAAAQRVESGGATVPDIQAALSQPEKIDFGLAPPEPLTLMDVEYDERFEAVRDPTDRKSVV